MTALGLKLSQAPVNEGIKNIYGQLAQNEQGAGLDDEQKHFSKPFSNVFNRIERIRNDKIQEEFLKNQTPVQQKGRRVPITLQG